MELVMYMLLYQLTFELIKLKRSITSNWTISSVDAVLNYCPYGAEATARYLAFLDYVSYCCPVINLKNVSTWQTFEEMKLWLWVMNATVSDVSFVSTVQITDVNTKLERFIFLHKFSNLMSWSSKSVFFSGIYEVFRTWFSICIHKLIHSS